MSDEILHCRTCPYGEFHQNLTGGTESYHCKLDRKTMPLAYADHGDDPCKASLDILRKHQFANSLFADTIRIRSEQQAAEAAERAQEARLVAALKGQLLGLTGDLVPLALVRRACDELEREGLRK